MKAYVETLECKQFNKMGVERDIGSFWDNPTKSINFSD